jgi:hypothetical protein
MGFAALYPSYNFCPSGKSALHARPFHPNEGRLAIVTSHSLFEISIEEQTPRRPQTQSAATAAICIGELPISQPLLDAGGEAGHSVQRCALRTIATKRAGSG